MPELTEKEWQEIQDDLDQKHKDFEDTIKNAKHGGKKHVK